MALDASEEVGGGRAGPGPVIKRLLVGGALTRNADIHQGREGRGGLSPNYRILRVEPPAWCSGPYPTDGV